MRYCLSYCVKHSNLNVLYVLTVSEMRSNHYIIKGKKSFVAATINLLAMFISFVVVKTAKMR